MSFPAVTQDEAIKGSVTAYLAKCNAQLIIQSRAEEMWRRGFIQRGAGFKIFN